MNKEEITVELIARTAIELKKLPQYDKRSLTSLVGEAHDFLLECSKVKQMHETGFCTWLEAIRRVTGHIRVRAQQLEAFDRFFVDQHPQGDDDENYSWLQYIEKDLAECKRTNSVPLGLCDRLAVRFASWQQKELKKEKKILAHRLKGQESTSKPQKRS